MWLREVCNAKTLSWHHLINQFPNKGKSTQKHLCGWIQCVRSIVKMYELIQLFTILRPNLLVVAATWPYASHKRAKFDFHKNHWRRINSIWNVIKIANIEVAHAKTRIIRTPQKLFYCIFNYERGLLIHSNGLRENWVLFNTFDVHETGQCKTCGVKK